MKKKNEKFIQVNTSPYVPYNPDKSVPVNGHFDIMVKKAVQDSTAKRGSDTVDAKAAPKVILSKLTQGEYPLFANSNEVMLFAGSLILSSSDWSKSHISGSDEISFIYQGESFSLPEVFLLSVYSDAFNTTVSYRKRAQIQIQSSGFSSQFADAFEDCYFLDLKQVYIPEIIYFLPDNISPVEQGGREYEVELNREVLLKWQIKGDSLKSPTLTVNGGATETVSFDTPVKKKITEPSVYELCVESNAYLGIKNSRKLFFGISTPPEIENFQSSRPFCLACTDLDLQMEVKHAAVCLVSGENTCEKEREVSPDASIITMQPVPKDPEKLEIGYYLTAGGYRGKESVSITRKITIGVSRWEKSQEQPAAGIPLSEQDKENEIISLNSGNFFLAGQKLLKSGDGVSWETVSELVLGEGLEPTRFVMGGYEETLYIAGGAADGLLYFITYDIRNQCWSEFKYFGTAKELAGGTFVMINEELHYYITAAHQAVLIYNYVPEPVEHWGIAGKLYTPFPIRAVTGMRVRDTLYIAVACEDKCLYIYNTTLDLQGDVPMPLKINAASAWIKMIQADGTMYVASDAGIFHLVTGEQVDLMPCEEPRLFGVLGETVIVFNAQNELWIMKK